MKLIDNNPFRLACLKGESITVEVKSRNTAHLADYDLNGETSGQLLYDESLRFPFHNHTLLRLYLGFSEAQGGVYRIRVNGKSGEDVSEYILKQSPNPVMSGALTYEFIELGGDETKGDYD